MADYLWYDWDLPIIYLHLVTILVFVFIICIIVWIITIFLRPLLALRRRPKTAKKDQIEVMDEFEDEGPTGDYEELVLKCIACNSNIEVRATSLPVSVNCGNCGTTNTAK